MVYRDAKRNIRPRSWSPPGDRIIFSIGEIQGFFDGFPSPFLKPADSGEPPARHQRGDQGRTTLTAAYDNFPLWSPRGDLIMLSRLIDV